MSEPLAQKQHWDLVVWAYPDTYQSPQSRLSSAFLSPDGPKTRENDQKWHFETENGVFIGYKDVVARKNTVWTFP